MKKGDTLVEVALAVGIFSMVAITVVSVTSASTSSAQSSLETTITREELDAQAEAIRFIHDSYVAGTQSKDVTKNDYGDLWNKIVKDAKYEEEIDSGLLSYTPKTCSEMYDTKHGKLKASALEEFNPFIINTRKLNINDLEGAVIFNDSGSSLDQSDSVFYEPATYPRIIYGNGSSANNDQQDQDSLYSQVNSSYADIRRVEGIYIIVTKGDRQLISGNPDESTTAVNKTAYYDFYIRSCWMPVGSDRASTISTVVHLYDPAVIEY